MRRFFAAALATTAVVWTLPAFAQDSLDAVNRVRAGLLNMGVVAVLPDPEFGDSVAVLDGVRVVPLPDSGADWSIVFGALRLSAEPDGWIVARSTGPISLSTGRGSSARTVAISAPDLEMRLGPDTPEGEVEGWSFSAPAVSAFSQDHGGFSMEGEDLRYEGGESAGGGARHEIHARRLDVLMGERGKMLAMQAHITDLEMALSLHEGGLLETFPWMAAVPAGLSADGHVEVGEASVEWGGVSQGRFADPIRHMSVGLSRVDASHTKEGISATWSAEEMEAWGELGVRGGFFARGSTSVLEGGAVSGSARIPVHASAAPLPMSLTLEMSGVVGGSSPLREMEVAKWPMRVDLDMTGSAQLPIEWYDYRMVEGVGQWRSFGSVFSPKTVEITTARLAMGEGDVSATGTLALQSGALEGAVDVATEGSEPVLAFFGGSHLFSADVAKTVVATLQAFFGPSAGTDGGTGRLVFEKGGVRSGDVPILPPRP